MPARPNRLPCSTAPNAEDRETETHGQTSIIQQRIAEGFLKPHVPSPKFPFPKEAGRSGRGKVERQRWKDLLWGKHRLWVKKEEEDVVSSAHRCRMGL